ncbi:hypothetical protein PR048_018181 [Dryococelus australis]|uniref:Uncharacterized protein n=1 Tax=Dryococelus australis TaxID=614101 RepID=A0ABQ9HBS3_9NEOP|nr:hypothetical protein PR048_018181 [Dryococelus australis]
MESQTHTHNFSMQVNANLIVSECESLARGDGRHRSPGMPEGSQHALPQDQAILPLSLVRTPTTSPCFAPSSKSVCDEGNMRNSDMQLGNHEIYEASEIVGNINVSTTCKVKNKDDKTNQVGENEFVSFKTDDVIYAYSTIDEVLRSVKQKQRHLRVLLTSHRLERESEKEIVDREVVSSNAHILNLTVFSFQRASDPSCIPGDPMSAFPLAPGSHLDSHDHWSSKLATLVASQHMIPTRTIPHIFSTITGLGGECGSTSTITGSEGWWGRNPSLITSRGEESVRQSLYRGGLEGKGNTRQSQIDEMTRMQVVNKGQNAFGLFRWLYWHLVIDIEQNRSLGSRESAMASYPRMSAERETWVQMYCRVCRRAVGGLQLRPCSATPAGVTSGPSSSYGHCNRILNTSDSKPASAERPKQRCCQCLPAWAGGIQSCQQVTQHCPSLTAWQGKLQAKWYHRATGCRLLNVYESRMCTRGERTKPLFQSKAGTTLKTPRMMNYQQLRATGADPSTSRKSLFRKRKKRTCACHGAPSATWKCDVLVAKHEDSCPAGSLCWARYDSHVHGTAVVECFDCSPPTGFNLRPSLSRIFTKIWVALNIEVWRADSQVGNVLDDNAGRRVFSGIARFLHPCIPELLHSHIISPSSSLKTSLGEVMCSSQCHVVRSGRGTHWWSGEEIARGQTTLDKVRRPQLVKRDARRGVHILTPPPPPIKFWPAKRNRLESISSRLAALPRPLSTLFLTSALIQAMVKKSLSPFLPSKPREGKKKEGTHAATSFNLPYFIRPFQPLFFFYSPVCVFLAHFDL